MRGSSDTDPAPYRWAGGTVTTAGWHSQFGNQVRITHPDGTVMIYAHLSKINVSVGQVIRQGESMQNINDDVARQIGYNYLGRNGYDGRPNALSAPATNIPTKPVHIFLLHAVNGATVSSRTFTFSFSADVYSAIACSIALISAISSCM